MIPRSLLMKATIVFLGMVVEPAPPRSSGVVAKELGYKEISGHRKRGHWLQEMESDHWPDAMAMRLC